MQFAPMGTYTVQWIDGYKKKYNMTFIKDYRVFVKKYGSKDNKLYGIFIQRDGDENQYIAKLDINSEEINKLSATPILDIHELSIDEINNKLYLLSSHLFCVFDLETNKYNLIKKIPENQGHPHFIKWYKPELKGKEVSSRIR